MPHGIDTTAASLPGHEPNRRERTLEHDPGKIGSKSEHFVITGEGSAVFAHGVAEKHAKEILPWCIWAAML